MDGGNLCNVLHNYHNYPQWIINQLGKLDKQDPIIHLETGMEIKKHFYISVPYFSGLSESYKKIFKYMPVQVCFKGVNTLKSMLMHPTDKISNDQKKDLVYTIGNPRQMGVTHPILEKCLGPLVRGSRNSPSQQPQPYLNIVKISTIHCPPSQILTS